MEKTRQILEVCWIKNNPKRNDEFISENERIFEDGLFQQNVHRLFWGKEKPLDNMSQETL